MLLPNQTITWPAAAMAGNSCINSNPSNRTFTWLVVVVMMMMIIMEIYNNMPNHRIIGIRRPRFQGTTTSNNSNNHKTRLIMSRTLHYRKGTREPMQFFESRLRVTLILRTCHSKKVPFASRFKNGKTTHEVSLSRDATYYLPFFEKEVCIFLSMTSNVQ
jgi:hypothetical protein